MCKMNKFRVAFAAILTMLPDNAVYYDYGGYTGNACITFKTNTANMLVCATNFAANGIRGIKYSAYNMMFTPLHVDRR